MGSGNLLGQVIEGDIEALVGWVVGDNGEILDENNDVVSRVSVLEEASIPAASYLSPVSQGGTPSYEQPLQTQHARKAPNRHQFATPPSDSGILFGFFNSDLVDQRVNFHGGASAYIDDYFRWRASRSAEENIRKIQEEDIPRIEAWAQRTGSSFSVEKTQLIHITRKKSEHDKGFVIMQGTTIRPSVTAKLLGVIFDQELRWKQHVQQVVKRATKVTIAMCGLRHLRPAQMRQLYQACVTPVVDYASTVWHNPRRDKTHLRVLGTVQRTALIRILSAFKTVATPTLEVESHVLPTRLRLKKRAQEVVTRLCTLPRNHPTHSALERAKRRSENIKASPIFPLAETIKTMDLRRLNAIETIDPRPLIPWTPPVFEEIRIDSDRDKASEDAKALASVPNTVVYSDASENQDHQGAAAVILDHNGNIMVSKQSSIGPKTHWSIHTAELIGIYLALELIKTHSPGGEEGTVLLPPKRTIICDSQSALKAIANPSNRAGQHIVHAIFKIAKDLKSLGVSVRLQWIPGHCNNLGNDTADRLAKEAVGLEKSHPFQHLSSREKQFYRDNIFTEWQNEWKDSSKGKHLRQIDAKLPSRHTRRLYDTLPRNRAYLLTQLRTGHSWLATHAKLHRFRDDDKCVCGGKETVVHVLIDCPRLRELRQKLREKIENSFNNISSMLGGEGKEVLNAVLDFAEASRRFYSRVPVRARTEDASQSE
jgi:ribonuclease HI